MATIEATSKQVLGLLAGFVASLAAVVAVLTPLVLGAARTEAQQAVLEQAQIDRAQYVTKPELQAVLRELDQIRGQLDRIEGQLGERK